jgi:phosphatidylinositol-3-phosphatase
VGRAGLVCVIRPQVRVSVERLRSGRMSETSRTTFKEHPADRLSPYLLVSTSYPPRASRVCSTAGLAPLATHDNSTSQVEGRAVGVGSISTLWWGTHEGKAVVVSRAHSWSSSVFVVALLASGTAIWSATAERASAAPITKVLWIWEENSDPTSLIGTCVTCQQLPYLNGLASTYGYATNARAASIPSLPNYIAATSGDTWGIADDGGPGKHPLSVLNLFDQLPLGQAKVFAEGMTANCQLVNGPKTDVNGSGFYVVRHTAWPYYTNSRSACLANQVPLDENLQAAVDGGLPALSIVVPANCNNFHKGGSSPDACVLAPGQTYASRADAWLQSHIPAIMAGPDWQAGELAIFIVWDEGKGPAPTNGSDCTTSTLKACKIPLVVLSSGTTGVVDNAPYTTYSVLRTTEELLGLPLIGKAATATSMAAGFGCRPVDRHLQQPPRRRSPPQRHQVVPTPHRPPASSQHRRTARQ